MPSAKSIAITVTALAASGVHAGACKPSSSTSADILSTTEAIPSSTLVTLSTTEDASTTESATITEPATTDSATTESATESTTTSACIEDETIEEYVLKEDNPPERNCGAKGQSAQAALPPGPASSLGDCAQSCIEGLDGDPWECSLIAYFVENQLAPDVYTCERYGGGFTENEDGPREFYVNECFERRTVSLRGRGGCRGGGGRRLRRSWRGRGAS